MEKLMSGADAAEGSKDADEAASALENLKVEKDDKAEDNKEKADA